MEFCSTQIHANPGIGLEGKQPILSGSTLTNPLEFVNLHNVQLKSDNIQTIESVLEQAGAQIVEQDWTLMRNMKHRSYTASKRMIHGSDSPIANHSDSLLGDIPELNVEAAKSWQSVLSEKEQPFSQGVAQVTDDLAKFADRSDFLKKMQTAFGQDWNVKKAVTLLEDLVDGSGADELKIIEASNLPGSAAFSEATQTIYLSQDFLKDNANDPEAIASVLLEELGHYLDAKLNDQDSPGDEGEIFAALVQDKHLDDAELETLKTENDATYVSLNGQTDSVEQARKAYFRTTFIPTTRYMSFRHTNGTTVSIMRGNYQFKPTAHIAINGRYVGQYFLPLQFGDFQIGFKNQFRFETWNGSVRQVLKPVPFLQIFSRAWRRIG